jgi:hypothetical protein
VRVCVNGEVIYKKRVEVIKRKEIQSPTNIQQIRNKSHISKRVKKHVSKKK